MELVDEDKSDNFRGEEEEEEEEWRRVFSKFDAISERDIRRNCSKVICLQI